MPSALEVDKNRTSIHPPFDPYLCPPKLVEVGQIIAMAYEDKLYYGEVIDCVAKSKVRILEYEEKDGRVGIMIISIPTHIFIFPFLRERI